MDISPNAHGGLHGVLPARIPGTKLDFLSGILTFYAVELVNPYPLTILILSIFVHLCSPYICVHSVEIRCPTLRRYLL